MCFLYRRPGVVRRPNGIFLFGKEDAQYSFDSLVFFVFIRRQDLGIPGEEIGVLRINWSNSFQDGGCFRRTIRISQGVIAKEVKRHVLAEIVEQPVPFRIQLGSGKSSLLKNIQTMAPELSVGLQLWR